MFGCLFCSLSAFGGDVKERIQRDFDGVPCKLSDLVPFMKNGKQGYLDRRTGKVVVKAKYAELNFFNPNMIGGKFEDVLFDVSSSGDVQIQFPDEMISFAEACFGTSGITILSSEAGFAGFTVNNAGELSAYSDLYQYHTSGFPSWNVAPFKTASGYSAVVINKKGEKAVIDQSGKERPGFEFGKYKNILLNRYATDNIYACFFVTTDNKNWNMTDDGENMKLTEDIFEYPLTSANVSGYAVVTNDSLSGIADYCQMKWLTKPQNKIKYNVSIRYSSERKVDTNQCLDRKDMNFYILAEEQNKKYYVDLNGNRYLPGK